MRKKLLPVLSILLFVSLLNGQIMSSQECAGCHSNSFAQWKSSRHSVSSRAMNPFFEKMYNWAKSSGNPQLAENCLTCHEPVRFLSSKQQSDEQIINEGISCDVCHALKLNDNIDTWELAPKNVKYGPFKDALSSVHHSVYLEDIESNDFCLNCHSNSKNPHGVTFCSTELEWKKSSFAKKGVQCQDCHMPGVEGKASPLGKLRENVHSHVFYGGYSEEMLNNCAKVDLSAEQTGENVLVKVSVKNHGVGHALPTGSPMRMVFLKLEAKDAHDRIVWQNFSQNPIKEDPQAVFMKLLQDSNGNAPVPPWEAVAEKFDQRLKPDETREFEYIIQDGTAETIEVKLIYRLAPPPLLLKLGMIDEIYTKAKVINSKTVNIAKKPE